jgi:transposase
VTAVVLRGVAGRMHTVPRPYSREFLSDVVRVARDRECGQHIKQIAADFGISESCLAC